MGTSRLSAREEPPEPPSVLKTVTAAAGYIGRGARTSNVVPATFRAQLVVDDRFKDKKLIEDGRLADVAPTALHMMGLEKPEEMTGTSLIPG